MNEALARRFARREKVLAQIRTILIEKLHVRRAPEEIDPDTPLFGTGLRLDSVDAVELWVSVRHHFGTPLPAAERRVAAMRTLNTLADLILEGQREGSDDLR